LKIPLSSSPPFEEYAQSWGGVYSVPETDYRGDSYTFEKLLIEMWNKETKPIRTNSFHQRFCGHFDFINDMQPNAFAHAIPSVIALKSFATCLWGNPCTFASHRG
jgi:hypothetical protein